MLRLLRRWGRATDGGAAVEFSLVSIPYIFLCIGIIELAVMYSAGSMIEGATGSASRLIRTGQIQKATSADPQEMFMSSICQYARALVDCGSVQSEAVTLTSFTDANALNPRFTEDGDFQSTGFAVGGVNDRILVRVVYDYPMMTPFIGPLLTGATGKRTFISNVVLQTEPYEFTGS